MTELDVNYFSESAEWFLNANTPSYLYNHLKILGEVENLANKSTHQELFNICKKASEKKDKNYDSELVFYIGLIALSLKPYSEFSKYVESLKTSNYKWASTIISLIISNHQPVTTATIKVESKPKIKRLEKKSKDTDDSTTEQTMHFKSNPIVYKTEEGFSNITTSDNTINLEPNGD